MNDSIEKRIELKAPISRVWRALTDYREFGEWFRVKLDGPFVPGQVSRGQMTYPGYEHVKWEAVVQKMEPERLFSFTWPHPKTFEKVGLTSWSTQRNRPRSSNSGWRRSPAARYWCSPSLASITFTWTAVSKPSEETMAAGQNK